MRKTVKSRKSTAVQGTNDSSSVSKASQVYKGYFEDEFIHHFVKKKADGIPTIRSPLINRGYYIRNYILNKIICDFLNYFNQLNMPTQIISIGSGFDTIFFRLKQQNLLSTGSLFVEVDFPELQRRKLNLMMTADELRVIIGGSTDLKDPKSSIFWNNSCYKMIGCDLTKTSNLLALFQEAGLNLSVPTLFLSEVVLTYLNEQDASNFISWASTTFTDATFVTYEQVYPFDEFGEFMCKHFNKLGSPLKSISSFPLLQSQVDRYLERGWQLCTASTICNVLHGFLPSTELQRIEGLEMFDEFEEWILKCNHYFVLIATQGVCNHLDQIVFAKNSCIYEDNIDSTPSSHPLTFIRKSKYSMKTEFMNQDGIDNDHTPEYLAFDVELMDLSLSRYGHSSCIITHEANKYLLVVGGFGNTEQVFNEIKQETNLGLNPKIKHSRVKQMNIFNLDQNGCLPKFPSVTSCFFERMHSSCTCLHDERVLIFGGRKSPDNPRSEVMLLTFTLDTCLQLERILVANLNGGGHLKFKEVGDSKDINHIEDDNKDINNIEDDNKDINHIEDDNKDTIDQGPIPRWRHSATAVRIDQKDKSTKELIYIHGGITNGNKILSDTWCINSSTWNWERIPLSNNSPGALHSHSSDWWKSGHALVVTGGMNQCGQLQNSIHLLSLETHSWKVMSLGHLEERFSHTTHIHGNELILVGGVSAAQPSPGISMINLNTGVIQNFKVSRTIERVSGAFYQFHNHTSHLLISESDGIKILIFGGGGNYFSFGTKVRPGGLCFKLK